MKKTISFLLLIALFVGCSKKEQLSVNEPADNNLKCAPGDFWQVVSPSSQQMDENVLYGLAAAVNNFKNVKSLLIIRNGKIVHEQYLNGAGQDSLLNIASVTKRITSSLVGIAIDRKFIRSVDTHIWHYFPEIAYYGADPQWNNITVYHLVNMISGMDWIEVNDLPAFEYTFNNPNPLPMTFSRNIIHTPGTIFSYNSPGIHLLSYVIERSTRMRVGNFANATLFYPLGINKFKWQADGNKVRNGGANLSLRSRDLAKIGLLYLQNGMWQGKRILSQKWIDASLRTPINLDTLQGSYLATGPDLVSKPGMWMGNTWWTMNFNGETIHYGDGYGGQILLLIPKYNVVVVMNRLDNVSIQDNISAFNEFFSQVLPMVFASIH